MTSEEAIDVLKNDIEICTIQQQQACNMAIKALEIVNDFERAQIITGGRLNGRTHAYKCGLADGQRLAKGEKLFNILPLEQQPSDDCISRTELLSRIDAERKHLLETKMDGAEHIIVHHARRIIEDMPSVTPKGVTITDFADRCRECGKQKAGKWIDDSKEDGYYANCSHCGYQIDIHYERGYLNYCPNCGAEMEREE